MFNADAEEEVGAVEVFNCVTLYCLTYSIGLSSSQHHRVEQMLDSREQRTVGQDSIPDCVAKERRQAPVGDLWYPLSNQS